MYSKMDFDNPILFVFVLICICFCFGQFGDHLPRNISKAVEMLTELANNGSSVGQQVINYYLLLTINYYYLSVIGQFWEPYATVQPAELKILFLHAQFQGKEK